MILAGFIYLLLVPFSLVVFFVMVIPATLVLAVGTWLKELGEALFAGPTAIKDIAECGLVLLDKGYSKFKGGA